MKVSPHALAICMPPILELSPDLLVTHGDTTYLNPYTCTRYGVYTHRARAVVTLLKGLLRPVRHHLSPSFLVTLRVAAHNTSGIQERKSMKAGRRILPSASARKRMVLR
jgi:hypothetical protein